MPVVKSHQKQFLEITVNEVKSFEDSDSIVACITSNILRDSPELLKEFAGDRPDERLLEAAINRDIESHRYQYDIFRDELICKVKEFMLGYGELQHYIEDEDITDIDGTRFNQFLIKRHGDRSKIPVSFRSAKVFDSYCRLVVIRNGGILNEDESYYRVADKKHRLRISVSVSPGNIDGPAISIRKHRRESHKLEDLKELGMLDDSLINLLRKLALEDSSVLFCGKHASGKTTLLRAFINSLPEMERVLIIESDVEIYPDKPHCIEQQIRKRNGDCRIVTLKDLIEDGLAMPMDTYCIGDIAGDEAWQFIKAVFSGYRGIAAIHSKSAGDALTRLLTLCRGANNIESEKTIKDILGRSINFIFYLKEFKVVEVLEVVGYDSERDVFNYKGLYP